MRRSFPLRPPFRGMCQQPSWQALRLADIGDGDRLATSAMAALPVRLARRVVED